MSDQRPPRQPDREETPEPATDRPAVPARPAADLAAVPGATRSGDDARRRGWFWHWNSLVTQYAPLVGLKGVGLLNSYTVWTDRRDESPHRGYAFPSQQSEADFYGEDRAELITVNKILVALDLIEIRKEMVLRLDPQGRRWRVPHNFYRVKDHDDRFGLTSRDVLRVAELAARDRAVYRYVRRVFSPRFAPIDGDNVWHRILPEVRQTPLWQRLAARAEQEEARASARTRAGHAARKGASPEGGFFVPEPGDGPATPAPRNDSGSDTVRPGAEASVAFANTGSTADVAPTNEGCDGPGPSVVGAANAAAPTSVAPANTTYHQSPTTTNDGPANDLHGAGEGYADAVVTAGETHRAAVPPAPLPEPPGDGPAEAAALRAFEQANARAATPAERKLLARLAEQFELVAAAAAAERPGVPGSGWGWVAAAVWEAVDAGSAFVAPRRLREILLRWERDGFPAGPGDPAPRPTGGRSRAPGQGARRGASVAPAPAGDRPAVPRPPAAEPVPTPLFHVEEAGLSSRHLWAAVLADLERSGAVSRADLETWLHGTELIGRGAKGALVVGTANVLARRRVEGRYLPFLRDAAARVVGVDLPVEVRVTREWLAGGEEPGPDAAEVATGA